VYLDATYINVRDDALGQFVFNTGLGGCNLVEGAAGWTESYTRLDSTRLDSGEFGYASHSSGSKATTG
jgi:hypothetical protein